MVEAKMKLQTKNIISQTTRGRIMSCKKLFTYDHRNHAKVDWDKIKSMIYALKDPTVKEHLTIELNGYIDIVETSLFDNATGLTLDSFVGTSSFGFLLIAIKSLKPFHEWAVTSACISQFSNDMIGPTNLTLNFDINSPNITQMILDGDIYLCSLHQALKRDLFIGKLKSSEFIMNSRYVFGISSNISNHKTDLANYSNEYILLIKGARGNNYFTVFGDAPYTTWFEEGLTLVYLADVYDYTHKYMHKSIITQMGRAL